METITTLEIMAVAVIVLQIITLIIATYKKNESKKKKIPQINKKVRSVRISATRKKGKTIITQKTMDPIQRRNTVLETQYDNLLK